jgi:hypothetical protein
MNVTCRVDADRSAYTYGRAYCSTCNRPREVTGVIVFSGGVSVPQEQCTFFAPVFDRVGGFSGHRDVFVTEDIVRGFKDSGFKGGMFQRLLRADEEAPFRAAVERNEVFRWPKGSKISL